MENEQKVKKEQLQEISLLQSSIGELERIISENEEERLLLRQQLKDVELELRKSVDNHTTISNDYEKLIEERNLKNAEK